MDGKITIEELDQLWHHHHAQWRDPLQVTSLWSDAAPLDRTLLRYSVSGRWWELLEEAQITLLVTREYEHLVMAMGAREGKPYLSYMRLPHPSGIAVDLNQGSVYLASTRNPNQVIRLRPVIGSMDRLDMPYGDDLPERSLVPVSTIFVPGCLYMHDLAMIGGQLHANSVGQNAVIHLEPDGQHRRVWWPRCIEQDGAPVFGQNHLQLNSIAAGADLESSYFSASLDHISPRRPGHKNFPVDGRGVIFSGATREVMARGLTRPHSARLYRDRVWVDNSGYGELGYIDSGALTVTARLPGWTRGLAFHAGIAFVGTSRVIPRFRQYAPGLDVESSVCGVHAVHLDSGEVLGSILWEYGNQIFAIEAVPMAFASGFPFLVNHPRATEREKRLFYTFTWERDA